MKKELLFLLLITSPLLEEMHILVEQVGISPIEVLESSHYDWV